MSAQSRTGVPRTSLSRAERQDLRTGQRKRRRRLAWIISLLVMALVGAGGYVVWFTPVLGLKTVAVEGIDGPVAESVRAAAPAPDGTPLISIDLADVRDAVAAIPEVSQVQIRREWPGTLIIQVMPRVPVAVVSANSQLWLMDDTGRPYATTERAPDGLITLRLATPGAGDPATMAGLAVAADLPEPIVALVSAISARTQYDITLELKDGRSVLWGDTSQGPQKAQVIGPLLAQPGTVFDISDPKLVTAR